MLARATTFLCMLMANLAFIGCAADRVRTPQDAATGGEEVSRVLASLKQEAEFRLPQDAPAYLGVLKCDSVRAIAARPDRFLEAWKRDLGAERGSVSPPRPPTKYEEALVVVPRAFARPGISADVSDEYIRSLRWYMQYFDLRGKRIAVITLADLGEPNAVQFVADERRFTESLKAEFERLLPGEAPGYLNLLGSPLARRIAQEPDLFLDVWRRDLEAELKTSPRKLSKYAEGLVAAPRWFSRDLEHLCAEASKEYKETLRRVWKDERLDSRGRKTAMLTLVYLGDREAIRASADMYRKADEESRLEEYMPAFYDLSSIDLQYFGEPLWELANEILSACTRVPLTLEQNEWCTWLARNPNLSCFGAVSRIFSMYENWSPTEEQKTEAAAWLVGYIELVPRALVSINGSKAIPLLRRNFRNAWSDFAETCLYYALLSGDPEAMRFLILTIPPSTIQKLAKPDYDTDDADHLVSILKLLEPGILPETDDLPVYSGVDPVSADFEKAWCQLYDAVKQNRVQLIAKPESDEPHCSSCRRLPRFQIVYLSNSK